MSANRRCAVLVGTGHRGCKMWGREPLAGYGDFVALCDRNPLRAERENQAAPKRKPALPVRAGPVR